MKWMWKGIGVLAVLTAACPVNAEESVYQITLKEHRFDPSELAIPAKKKIKIIVENDDPTAEEFESYDLNREKVITGNSKSTIFVGPLKPGRYKYFGDFNPKTAQGEIVAKAMGE